MRRHASLALIALAFALPMQARAQDYPSRPVTIVAPAAPGGLYSLFARLIATKLEQRFGKSFIVENRPGASSIVGATSVVRSPPDGHTLMVANNTGLAVSVTINRNLPYDPVNDLTPIALIARVPEVLVVNAALPVQSVAELAALGKATPGGLAFGSAGVGTTQHLSAVVLSGLLGIEMTHVPYKGMSPAINDVAAGHIPVMFSPIPFALPLAQAGKLRMLGLNLPGRVEAVPDVRSLADIGFRAFDTASWFMLVAPARTPQPIIDRLHQEMRAVTGDPAVRREFTTLGLVPVDSPPPDELKRFVRSEIARWGAIVKQAGLAGTE